MASNDQEVDVPQDNGPMVIQPVASVVLAAKDFIRINGDLYQVAGTSPLFLMQYRGIPLAEESSNGPSAIQKHQSPVPNPLPVNERDGSLPVPMSPRAPQLVRDNDNTTENAAIIDHTSSTPSTAATLLSPAVDSGPTSDPGSSNAPHATLDNPPAAKRRRPLPDRRPLPAHQPPAAAPLRLTKLSAARESRDDAQVLAKISATAEKDALAAVEKAQTTAPKALNIAVHAESTVKSIHFTGNEVQAMFNKIKIIADDIQATAGDAQWITRETQEIAGETEVFLGGIRVAERKALAIMDKAQAIADAAFDAVDPAKVQAREAGIRAKNDQAALRVAEQKFQKLAGGNGQSDDRDRPWGCKACGRNYADRNTFKYHTCKPQDRAATSGRFLCNSTGCTKSYLTKKALEEHQKVCSNQH